MGKGNEERKIKDDAEVLSWDEWENSGRWWLKKFWEEIVAWKMMKIWF